MSDRRDAPPTSVSSLPTNTPWQSLRETASILRAPLFKSQSARNGVPYRVVSIKDFPDAGYLPAPGRSIRVTDTAEKARRYVLHPYDLLVITVGSIGHVTVVPGDCEDNWIPATNMYVVRFSTDAPRRSRATYAVLKSPSGQSLLGSMARGRGIQIVPKKVFAQIQVPVFSDEVLQVTEQLWERERMLYKEALQKIEQSRAVFDGFQVVDAESIAG